MFKTVKFINHSFDINNLIIYLTILEIGFQKLTMQLQYGTLYYLDFILNILIVCVNNIDIFYCLILNT